MTSSNQGVRRLEFIASDLGINHKAYDEKPLRKFVDVITRKIEDSYKEFTNK